MKIKLFICLVGRQAVHIPDRDPLNSKALGCTNSISRQLPFQNICYSFASAW